MHTRILINYIIASQYEQQTHTKEYIITEETITNVLRTCKTKAFIEKQAKKSNKSNQLGQVNFRTHQF